MTIRVEELLRVYFESISSLVLEGGSDVGRNLYSEIALASAIALSFPREEGNLRRVTQQLTMPEYSPERRSYSSGFAIPASCPRVRHVVSAVSVSETATLGRCTAASLAYDIQVLRTRPLICCHIVGTLTSVQG